MRRIDVDRELASEIREGKQIKKFSLDRLNSADFRPGDRMKIYEDSTLVSITEALVDSADIDNLDGGAIVLKLLRVFN
jgi:hypothetical protein